MVLLAVGRPHIVPDDGATGFDRCDERA